jgi:DNA-binding NtrC family response regulator
MVTGFGSIETAVEAMRLGATDYLTKPCNNQELIIKIRRALEAGKKDRELRQLREELRGVYSVGSMVSRSDNMKEVVHQIRRLLEAVHTPIVLQSTRRSAYWGKWLSQAHRNCSS